MAFCNMFCKEASSASTVLQKDSFELSELFDKDDDIISKAAAHSPQLLE